MQMKQDIFVSLRNREKNTVLTFYTYVTRFLLTCPIFLLQSELQCDIHQSKQRTELLFYLYHTTTLITNNREIRTFLLFSPSQYSYIFILVITYNSLTIYLYFLCTFSSEKTRRKFLFSSFPTFSLYFITLLLILNIFTVYL